MTRIIGWSGLLGVVGAIAAAFAYWWLVLDASGKPRFYDIDIGQVRRAALSTPGDLPVDVAVEHVATFSLPKAAIIAGADWKKVDMPIFAYQIDYADHRIIVDTGQSARQTRENRYSSFFDPDARQRVDLAMDTASLIVVTHEHVDHIGGLMAHPALQTLLERTVLTPDHFSMLVAGPEAPFRNRPVRYQPLIYEGVYPLAPGVALIKAPGHTPGSQMIYVRLLDGREILIAGDVAQKAESYRTLRLRPRLIGVFKGHEDRAAVLGEMNWLNDLETTAPNLRIVPGHDGEAVSRLIKQGWLKDTFVGAP